MRIEKNLYEVLFLAEADSELPSMARPIDQRTRPYSNAWRRALASEQDSQVNASPTGKHERNDAHLNARLTNQPHKQKKRGPTKLVYINEGPTLQGCELLRYNEAPLGRVGLYLDDILQGPQ